MTRGHLSISLNLEMKVNEFSFVEAQCEKSIHGVSGHALIFDVGAGRISLTFLSICVISLFLFKRTSTHSQGHLNIKKSEIEEILLIFIRSHNHYTRNPQASISRVSSNQVILTWTDQRQEYRSLPLE